MSIFNNKGELAGVNFKSLDSIDSVIGKYLEVNSFNNIEIILNQGKILSLDYNDLFNKIEIKKEGGYCFEHNKLFFHALINSGAKCSASLARVVYGKTIDVPKTHRITVLHHQKGNFLVDVGFGAYTPSKMIPLSGEDIVCHNNNRFKVEKIKENKLSLKVLRGNSFFTLYEFDRNQYSESDFNLSNYYTNTHPNSKFIKGLIISKYTQNSIVFINDLIFSEITKTKRNDLAIGSIKILKEILLTHFSINLSANEAEVVYSHSKKF